MRVKLITEQTMDTEVLVEDVSGEKNYFIEGIFMQADVLNGNKRIYPKHILQREANSFINEKILKNKAIGELNHPQTPGIEPRNVSHKIVSLHEDGNNYVGKAKILDTDVGRIVKEFLREGIQIGVSSRGTGIVVERNGMRYVGDNYRLHTIDIVTDPSGPDCFVNGVLESVDFLYQPTSNAEAQAIMEIVHEANKTNQLNELNKLVLFERFLKSINK